MTELYLIAHLAGRPVAISSQQVESVVDIGEIVPVPRASAQVRGLAALRSRVVTVIDSRVALDLVQNEAPATRAVITVIDGQHYAILVDSLEDVAPFELRPLSPGIVLDRGWRAVGQGIVELDEEAVLAIDLHALIPGAQLAA